MEYLADLQRTIYGAISSNLAAFAATRNWSMLATVLPVGILFGALHALMPGHGKAVLASYLVGSRDAAVKAMAIAGLQALTHVGSAVVLALLASQLVTRTLGGVGRAPTLELISRGTLIAIGTWLIVRAVRGQAHVHGEGVAVGVVAGLVPCPLTLFAMFYALARGVPEAGLTFALAMMLGVGLTLMAVALAAVSARTAMLGLMAQRAVSMRRIVRALDGAAGGAMIAIAARELTF